MTGASRSKLVLGVSGMLVVQLALSGMALGQNPPAPSERTLSESSSEKRVSTGYSFLFGLYPAYLTSKPHAADDEGGREGFFAGGAAYLSGVADHLILDAGAGWFYSRIEGDDPVKTVETSSATESQKVHYVGTTAGYGDVGVRFRYRDFHLGPQALILFGEDTSYAPVLGARQSNVWVGGQLGWIHRDESTDIRIVARYDTDLTIRERQVSLVGLQIQFGIPFGRQKVTRTVVKERVQYRERLEIQEKKVEVVKPVEVVKFMLNNELVNFETDSDALLPDSRWFLENLGKLLARKREMWQTLSVEGHTDARGSPEHNQDLSVRRALAVANVLWAQGAPRTDIRVQGFGSTRPLDLSGTPVAWARNRRVELRFQGVANQQEFMEELNRVRLLTRKPETCNGNSCR